MLRRFYSLAVALTVWAASGASNAETNLWCTGYYPGREQSAMPASEVDFAALTHVIHFALLPDSDGTLNYNANQITSANSADLIAHAHAAGRKALICAGGADSESGFRA